MKSPLNRTSAPKVVTLFDVCFKNGVIDACKSGDDFECHDFITRHKDSFKFGVLGAGDGYDWQLFRFSVYRWARNAGLTTIAENYIMMIRKRNYLWCLLPYCLRFYIMGIEEWLAYKNPSRIEVFKKENKTHWDPASPVKRFTLPDYVSYLHEFAYEYRKIEPERQIVGPGTMDVFCQALYSLTRKYVRTREQRKEENI